jgi:SAM-dependent methyltransferase
MQPTQTPITEAERQVLIAHLELDEPFDTPNNTHYTPHPHTFDEAALYFLNRKVEWEPAIVHLLQTGLLAPAGADGYTLTTTGRANARRERLDHPPIWYWYREYYTRTAHSPVYSSFCARLYGHDLTQTDFSDMPQLEFLLQQAGLQSGSRVLDLGCGNGKFAEYVSDATGAHVRGLDYVPEAIEQALQRTQAKCARLDFSVGNLDHLDDLPGPFDLLTSIDTLYMPNDLPATLRKMNNLLAPGGKILVFYSEMCFDPHQPRTCLLPDGTSLARALQAAGLAYTTWDFSAATLDLLRRKRQLAEEMRPLFEQEGSLFLLNHLLAESDDGNAPYDPNTCYLARYLYRIDRFDG